MWRDREWTVQKWGEDSRVLSLSVSLPNKQCHLEQIWFTFSFLGKRKCWTRWHIKLIELKNAMCMLRSLLARVRVKRCPFRAGWANPWPLCWAAWLQSITRGHSLPGEGRKWSQSNCFHMHFQSWGTEVLWSQPEREAIYPLSHPSEASWGVHDLGLPNTFCILILERELGAMFKSLNSEFHYVMLV